MSGAEKVSRMLENSPLPQLVENLAKAIAESQFEIDKIMIQRLQMLADTEEHGVQLPGEEKKRSMLELGFAPTFYHFSEMNIKARVAFSSAEMTSYTVGGSIGAGYGIVFASVNASYTNRYSFNAEGSSEINTKIIAVPPPAELTEIISDLVEKRKKQ
jgi:hypothetical protein